MLKKSGIFKTIKYRFALLILFSAICLLLPGCRRRIVFVDKNSITASKADDIQNETASLDGYEDMDNDSNPPDDTKNNEHKKDNKNKSNDSDVSNSNENEPADNADSNPKSPTDNVNSDNNKISNSNNDVKNDEDKANKPNKSINNNDSKDNASESGQKSGLESIQNNTDANPENATDPNNTLDNSINNSNADNDSKNATDGSKDTNNNSNPEQSAKPESPADTDNGENASNEQGLNEVLPTEVPSREQDEDGVEREFGIIIDDLTKSLNTQLTIYPCQYLPVYVETADDMVTVNKSTEEEKIINSAAGENVGTDLGKNSLTISAEWLLKKDPQPEFFIKEVDESVLGKDVKDTLAAEKIVDEICAREGFQEIKSIKNRNVFLVSNELLDSEAGRLMFKYYVANLLHPDLFTEINLNEIKVKLLGEGGIYAYRKQQ